MLYYKWATFFRELTSRDTKRADQHTKANEVFKEVHVKAIVSLKLR